LILLPFAQARAEGLNSAVSLSDCQLDSHEEPGVSTESNKTPTLQMIIDSFAEPFVVIDPEYQIVAANRLYAEHYGVRDGSVVGRRCHEVSHRSERPCSEHGEHCPLEQVLRTRETTQVLHIHPLSDGGEEKVQITGTPLFDSAGRLVYMGETMCPLGSVETVELIVGRSRAALNLISQLHRVAPTKTTALLLGESGVGKERAAEYIHKHSRRADGPFVVVDCGTLSSQLIESELFGHEKGAFTGAQSRKSGLFERADGGTLFIDEICELPLELQTKLLRVLETGTIRHIGGTDYRKVDVRIVAATNKNPQRMVANGEFREDLYYRLSAFPIHIPSLRARKEDIPLLAEHFLSGMEGGLAQLPLSSRFIAALLNYDYPGNIRELRNVIERALILAAGDPLQPQHLVFDHDLGSEVLGLAGGSEDPSDELERRPQHLLSRRGERPEPDVLLRVLEQTGGNRAAAAVRLGVSERTLYRMLKEMRAGR